ncbi:MAG: class II fructose-bisphosphate aldolase [Patescibacteria group bacterium]
MRIKKIFEFAAKKEIAIGHFNVSNAETFDAAVRASRKTKLPVIIGVSEGAIEHSGLSFFTGGKNYYSEKYQTPVYLHIDHGRNLKIIKEAIKAGFDSVMIDASHLSYNENVKITKHVVDMAHKAGVWVEAELGTIGGREEAVEERTIQFTDPSRARDFVAESGCDSLAVAIGTSHGIHKFSGPSKLDLRRLAVISQIVSVPLVLHGASSINSIPVRTLQSYGLPIKDAHGVSKTDLRRAISLGIKKINVDTDLQLAMISAMFSYCYHPNSDLKVYKMLDQASDAMEKEVIKHIRFFAGYDETI